MTSDAQCLSRMFRDNPIAPVATAQAIQDESGELFDHLACEVADPRRKLDDEIVDWTQRVE